MRDLIRKILREALGVPEGILESGEVLYEIINQRLKRLKFSEEDDVEQTFKLNVDIKISDYTIKKVTLHIHFVYTDQLDKVDFISMAFANRSKLNNEKFYMVNVITPNEVELAITLGGPEGSTKQNVLEYFKDNKDKIISSLTHELGHAFNYYKKGRTSVKSVAKYSGLQQTSFPFKPINDFLHYLYFIHAIENIVRPIEVASLMRSGEIDREKFYEFITNNRTYKMLKEINNFSYQKFREDLKQDSKNIKKFIKKIGGKVESLKTPDEIVDELLRILYVNLMNNTLSDAREMMTQSPLEMILGFQENKENFFQKLVKSLIKFESNPEKFYLYEEKNFKIVSEKMMKKLIKLWDMAKVNPSSIENWELHHKINKTGEKFETELKYKGKRPIK